jgi:peptidoglycan/xylan/chitin deacetylase (PgdA/CDA1 family)
MMDRLHPPDPGIVLLIYHRIGTMRNEITLPPLLFERQMAWLAASGRVIPLASGLDLLTRKAAIRERKIVVTFDDGSADFTDLALPILIKYSVPSTLYLSTMYVEDGRPFRDGTAPACWDALRDAVATGLVSVGSHTHSHALLNRLGSTAIAIELTQSVSLIRDRLDWEPNDFAYPKAVRPSNLADAIVRAQFRSAALGGGRSNLPGATDVHRLARTFVQRSDGWRWFLEKVDGGLAGEDAIRRAFDLWRYHGASS